MTRSATSLLFIFVSLFLALLHPAAAEQVVFSEIMYHPSGELPEFIEIQNLTSTPFDIAKWQLSGGVDFQVDDFNDSRPMATFMKAFERVVFSSVDPATFRAAYGLPDAIRVFGPWQGNLRDDGERVSLKDKNGVKLCSLRYNDRGSWPVSADGAGHSLVLVNDSLAIDDYRAWQASATVNGTPGNPEPGLAEEPYPNPSVDLSVGIPYIEYGDKWDYHDLNTNLGTSWRSSNYNYSHSGWTRENAANNQGGLYGFENSAVPAPGMRTPLLNSDNEDNHLTYYFRKSFKYTGPTSGVSLTIDQINDDGTGYWLNGQWLGGVATTASAEHFDKATRTVSNASEELAVVTSSNPPLVQGINVLAVTLKQTNASSSDTVFGARLSISTPLATSILLNEILPADTGDGFVEFYNPSASPVDLTGWYLSDDANNLTKNRIPAGITVPGDGLATVGFRESSLNIQANTQVFLTQDDGTTVVNAISTAMPLDGRSLGRKPEGGGSWFLFASSTPGNANVSAINDGSQLSLSEWHFNAEAGTIDWVELHNAATVEASTEGLWLASLRDFSDKVPLELTIDADGAASLDTAFIIETNLASTLFLINSSNQVLDAAYANAHPERPYVAAYPQGSRRFYLSASGSRDLCNDPERETNIVITELMVEPPTGHRDGEFIELYNNGRTPIDLSGWEFDRGVNFSFSNGTTLNAGGYLVVAANPTFTSAVHEGVTVLGPYQGDLANGGELLRLVDRWGNVADQLHFHTGGNWPQLAAGLGSSLELRHPDMDNSVGTAWADSDESDKSEFATYSISERYERLRSSGQPSDYEELHLHAVGDAHLIMKGMRLTRNNANTNILPNNGSRISTNGAGNAGWLCQGTHFASRVEGDDFHLISDGHGDIKANRCEIDITAIRANDNLTFTFEGRWVSGKPTLVVHSWDRSFGGIIRLPIPSNLGTPGAANSSALDTAAPTLSRLLHSPAVPSSNEPVRVTAHVDSALALTSVNLRHRIDSTNGDNAWQSTGMHDDGSNGDHIAGDQIYTASLTQYQGNNTIVQFYVEATSMGGKSALPKLGADRPGLWVVDNSGIPRDLRTQRFVISEQSLNAMGGTGESSTFNYAFPRLSNHYFNTTFISNEADIIYNCEIRKSGSPWTRSSGSNLSRAKWKTPGDRRFRGYSRRGIDNDAGGSRAYHNRIIRYWLYLFGHAANENEFVRVIINGGNPALREDLEPNANDFLKRNWEDGQLGELYRIDDEWWFQDNWDRQNRNADWSYKDTDEPERYHSEWIKRSRETEYDYSSFVSWVKTVGENDFTREEIERTADIDLMAANMVVRGWCDDWDTLTRNRGKNGYFLRRASDNRWMLIQWDSDLTFGNANATFLGNLPGVRNLFTKPYVKQRVNYYLGQMIEKYTHESPRLEAWFLCEEEASASYSNNEGTYISWNADRVSRARSEIGNSALNAQFNVTTGNGSSTSTNGEQINLSGISPHDAFSLKVVGHPEAEWQFNTPTNWSITGIALSEGSNRLQVQALDADGNVVGSETFTVNKAGNTRPVMNMTAKPSFRLALGNTLELDISESYDPEGTPLNFSWTVSPEQGVSWDEPGVGVLSAKFTTPGLYTFTGTGLDEDGRSLAISREVAVYAPSGWSSFTEPILESHWSLENVFIRDGSTPTAWYSLNDRSGKLTMKLEADSAMPLRLSNASHPTLLRELPQANNWVLQSDVELVTIQQGAFNAGVIAELTNNGVRARYSISVEDGDFLRAHRITSNGAIQLASLPWADKHAVLRLRLFGGSTLSFDYRLSPGDWVTLSEQTVHAGGPMTGGIFMATDNPQAVRTEFDYIMLVDPSAASPAISDLRITEIMFHPADPLGSEYLELHNGGDQPLSLGGLTFEATRPFQVYTLEDVTLAPGEYAVIVSDRKAFEATYGDSVRILGQWPGGALANGGERILLQDAFGNEVFDLTYDDGEPWPVAADGQGASLEMIDALVDYDDPANWAANSGRTGSPGAAYTKAPEPVDSDGDGLTDSEEADLGTSPSKTDTDGDGMNDRLEQTAGTDPNNRNSYFQVLSITSDQDAEEITTTWVSAPGQRYLIQSSPSLDGIWSDVRTVTATEATTTQIETTNNGQGFFRVVLLKDKE